jgi:hypothetical protein
MLAHVGIKITNVGTCRRRLRKLIPGLSRTSTDFQGLSSPGILPSNSRTSQDSSPGILPSNSRTSKARGQGVCVILSNWQTRAWGLRPGNRQVARS